MYSAQYSSPEGGNNASTSCLPATIKKEIQSFYQKNKQKRNSKFHSWVQLKDISGQ